jgi:hypothetical protein
VGRTSADQPGGQIGFLIVVNVLVFVLAFFLDFFELAFIIVPLLGPVAEKMGIDLVWFGVVLAINMQTSFMHPPFGFALFYLRSVAPHQDYDDRLTKKRIAKVTTGQIYWGAVPFVVIQVIMVGIVIAFPQLVTGGITAETTMKAEDVKLEAAPAGGYGKTEEDQSKLFAPPAGSSAPPAASSPGAPGAAAPEASAPEDPMEAMKRAMEQDAKKKP